MLEVKNISSGYGKKQVLHDVSLHVEKSEVVLLTGGNGSGKSTLLKCIYNLLPCWSGEIFFEGEKINGLKPFNLIKRGIVYIPQKDFCFENLTIEENLKIAGSIYSKKELLTRIKQVYKQAGLQYFKNRKPFNLSSGERKILAFGMGIIHKPKLILFDELWAGVDTIKSKQISTILGEYIYEVNSGIIIVEHKDSGKDIYTKKILMELGNLKN